MSTQHAPCRDKLVAALRARGYTACCCHVEVSRAAAALFCGRCSSYVCCVSTAQPRSTADMGDCIVKAGDLASDSCTEQLTHSLHVAAALPQINVLSAAFFALRALAVVVMRAAPGSAHECHNSPGAACRGGRLWVQFAACRAAWRAPGAAAAPCCGGAQLLKLSCCP